MRRRDFLFSATVAAGAPLVVAESAEVEAAEGRPLTAGRQEDILRGEMRYRKLGRTGEVISCIGLGGFHIGIQKDEQESIRIIRRAIDAGINFLDNCWDYNDGQSELRMGKAL